MHSRIRKVHQNAVDHDYWILKSFTTCIIYQLSTHTQCAHWEIRKLGNIYSFLSAVIAVQAKKGEGDELYAAKSMKCKYMQL